MEAHIKSSGITYIGTDWTCQSGGGYFGGFQTFDEFLCDGPIQKMPEHVAAEIRSYLETHRVPGGAKLLLLHLNSLDGFVLQGVYVHLDDKPLIVSTDEILAHKQEVTLFEGSIGIGDHHISLLLVFRPKAGNKVVQKVPGEFTLIVKPGEQRVRLVTLLEKDGTIKMICQQ